LQSRVEMQHYSINIAFISISSQALYLLDLKNNIYTKVYSLKTIIVK